MSFERVPDPRALRTRQAVFAAVERLTVGDRPIGDRPIGDGPGVDQPERDLTVSDIVREAGISRSSFYAHFDDVAAVASGLLAAEFARIPALDVRDADVRSAADAARLRYARLVEHLTDGYAFHSRLRASAPLRGAFDEALVSYCRDLVLGVLPGDHDEAEAEITAAYAAGGSLAVIVAWLGGRIDGTDDELVDHLVAYLPHWVTDAPQPLPLGSRSGPRSARSLTKGTT